MDIKAQKMNVEALKNKIKNSNAITFKQTEVDYKDYKYNAWEVSDNGKPIFTMCGNGKENFTPLIIHEKSGDKTIELGESVSHEFWEFLDFQLVQLPARQKSSQSSTR